MFEIKSGLLSEQGFTLVETVVFIIVLGIIASILIPFTVGLRGSSASPIAQEAISLAQGELEQTIAKKHASGFGSVSSGACVPSMPTTAFSCSRTVCYVNAANVNDTSCTVASSNFKRVQVTITNSAIGSVTAVTLLTNY